MSAKIETVKVFGLGALGGNLLVQLVRQYPELNYVGIDFDFVEERNIRPQAFFRSQVKAPKAKAIQVVA